MVRESKTSSTSTLAERAKSSTTCWRNSTPCNQNSQGYKVPMPTTNITWITDAVMEAAMATTITAEVANVTNSTSAVAADMTVRYCQKKIAKPK